MRRRSFLAALIATPVVMALAPFIPKPLWTEGMRVEYAYQLHTRLSLLRADITAQLLHSLESDQHVAKALLGDLGAADLYTWQREDA